MDEQRFYNDRLFEKRKQLEKYVERKYGEDAAEHYLYLNSPESIKQFQKLFQIGDQKLNTVLWNSIWLPSSFSPDQFKEIEFSQKELEFLEAKSEAEEKWITIDKSKNYNNPIETDRLLLCSPSEDDTEQYQLHLIQDGDFELYTGMKVTKKHIHFFSMRGSYTFAVKEKGSDLTIGMVGLYGYDDIRRKAQIQWYIFKPYRGKGYLKEAVIALSKKAFSGKLFEPREGIREGIFHNHFAKIDIIRAVIRVTNIPSQKAALSCGFEKQFTERRKMIINEKDFEDGIIYELTTETKQA